MEEARGRDPLVGWLALLRGSRVLVAGDRDEGRAAFAKAASGMDALALPPHDQELALGEVLWTGAEVDPRAAAALLRRPVSPWGHGRSFAATMVVQRLAQEGLVEAALAVLEDQTVDTAGAGAVLSFAKGHPEWQRRALVAQLERWHAARERQDPRAMSFEAETYTLFARYGVLLLPDAAQWLGQLVAGIEGQEDLPVGAHYDAGVSFTRRRDWHLFQLLGPIRALRSEAYVSGLLARYPELALAAMTYPSGAPQPEPRPAQTPPRPAKDGYPAQWHTPRFLDEQLAEAHEKFRKDSRRNDSGPRALWPSCSSYRTAMWHVGRVLGETGTPRLQEIPDRDFALLASIELAAGALGLPAYSGIRRG